MTGFDASELAGLGARLSAASAVADRLVSATVKRAGQNVKTAIEQDVSASHNRGIAGVRVGYETGNAGSTHYVDVSPREGGASELANIAFFGTARGGGTHRFYEHAQEELPNLQKYVGEAAVSALETLL